MRVVLFGAGNKGTQVLKKLIELKQEVIGVFYLDEDTHENIWYEKIEKVAWDNNISCYNHKYRGDKVNIIKQWKPDVIFVVGWRYKIPKEQYSIPPKGTIVFHDSLLPQYRGFAPMNWAIINGEKETGATMFYIADEIDNGDIIMQDKVAITDDDTAKTVEAKVTQSYLFMLESMMFDIEKDLVVSLPQEHSLATYTCKRIPEDGLIDWTKPAKDIYNLIRGLSDPYPNAFTYLNGEKIFILKAKLGDNKPYVGRICGRVINIIKDVGVEVLTGDGSIIIERFRRDNYPFDAAREIHSLKTTFGR